MKPATDGPTEVSKGGKKQTSTEDAADGTIAESQTTGGGNESLREDWWKNKQILSVVVSLSR